MMFLFIVNILFLILGCLVDVNVSQLVFVPLVIPLMNYFHIDPVHFGVMICLNMIIGLDTNDEEEQQKKKRARHRSPPRGRGLHLRRRDGPDRKPRRQAGLAADQAAVPGHRRPVPQADDREQRRNAVLRDAHPGARRRLVQIDRRAARSEQPARSGQLRPEAVLHQRAREQAGLRRIAAGRDGPRADRRACRRRVEGPQGEGGRAGRHQHGLSVGGRARHAARFRRARARSAAWAWARRRSWSSTIRRAWSTCSTTAAGSCRTNRAASARRAAKAPRG